MGSFFRILLKVFQFIRYVALAFALYGWFWLPRFQNGEANGPHWLLYLYDDAIPVLFGIGIVGLLLVFIYNIFIALIPRQSRSPMVASFSGLFWWILLIAVVGGLPSLVGHFSHMQAVVFNSMNYHLIERRNNYETAEYFVYQCRDPMGFWCHRVAVTSDFPVPPPTPTLFPTPVLPEGSTPDPLATPIPQFPTVTPPARLITDTLGIELSLEVGNLRAPITSTMTITDALRVVPNAEQGP